MSDDGANYRSGLTTTRHGEMTTTLRRRPVGKPPTGSSKRSMSAPNSPAVSRRQTNSSTSFRQPNTPTTSNHTFSSAADESRRRFATVDRNSKPTTYRSRSFLQNDSFSGQPVDLISETTRTASDYLPRATRGGYTSSATQRRRQEAKDDVDMTTPSAGYRGWPISTEGEPDAVQFDSRRSRPHQKTEPQQNGDVKYRSLPNYRQRRQHREQSRDTQKVTYDGVDEHFSDVNQNQFSSPRSSPRSRRRASSRLDKSQTESKSPKDSEDEAISSAQKHLSQMLQKAPFLQGVPNSGSQPGAPVYYYHTTSTVTKKKVHKKYGDTRP